MKPKSQYATGDKVKSATHSGVVWEVCTHADHVEYLVAQTDGTASWIHEDKLSHIQKSTNPPPNPK